MQRPKLGEELKGCAHARSIFPPAEIRRLTAKRDGRTCQRFRISGRPRGDREIQEALEDRSGASEEDQKGSQTAPLATELTSSVLFALLLQELKKLYDLLSISFQIFQSL
jgi:hypothetical protein